MRILFIHEVSYSKKMVYEYQLFAEMLSQRGHDVHVIDFDESGDNKYEKIRYSRTGEGEVLLEKTPYINLPIIKYISGRINHKKIILPKLKNKEIDVVFLYSVFISGTNTVRLCKKYNIPVVYRVLDAYHLLRRNILTMLPLYLGENYIYRNANVVCLTNDAMSEYVNKVAWTNIQNRIQILLHGVDTSFFNPSQFTHQLKERYGVKQDDKVLLFLGTTYVFSGLDLILENFEKVIKSHPTIKFLIVGKGDLDEKLKQIVLSKNLSDHVILTGIRPYAEMAEFINISTLSLNPFFINSITRNIIPIKILHCLAGGTPMLCTKIKDVYKYFPEYQSGVVYDDIENTNSFIVKIIDLLNNPVLLQELSANGISHIKKSFELSHQIDNLEKLLSAQVSKSA